MNFLEIILMLTAVVLIILSLLQSGKSDGLGSAFGAGEGLSLFANVKERGAEKTMSNITLAFGILFFAIIIIIKLMK